MSETWEDAVVRLEKEIVEDVIQAAHLTSFGCYFNAASDCFDHISEKEVEALRETYLNEAERKAMIILRYTVKAYGDLKKI